MILCSSVIGSIANTWYLVYGRNSLPVTLSNAFPGLEIHDGTLMPPMGSPFAPPAYLLAPIFNTLSRVPASAMSLADSMVVLDTAQQLSVGIRAPMVLMMKKKVSVYVTKETKMEFPYEYLLWGTKDFIFTPSEIRSHMQRYLFGIFLGYLLSSAVHDSGMFLFSIFFLALAAFIFRIDRTRRFKQYLKIAAYAISPIVIGSILVSIAGVKLPWVWHIMIFVSTVVMFRAIMAISNSTTSKKESL